MDSVEHIYNQVTTPGVGAWVGGQVDSGLIESCSGLIAGRWRVRDLNDFKNKLFNLHV